MNEQEFRSGVMADGSLVPHGHAFADSKAAAAAIMDGEQLHFDYITEAAQTLSPQWHGDAIPHFLFFARVADAVSIAERMDEIKKALFYGRALSTAPVSRSSASLHELPNEFGANTREQAARNVNIIHAILGVFTEAGELLEEMVKAYKADRPFDEVNLKEESGDIFWYLAIIARELGSDFDTFQRDNIAKLRKRFPDKFTEFDANNRDLAGERRILEGHTGTVADSDGDDGC